MSAAEHIHVAVCYDLLCPPLHERVLYASSSNPGKEDYDEIGDPAARCLKCTKRFTSVLACDVSRYRRLPTCHLVVVRVDPVSASASSPQAQRTERRPYMDKDTDTKHARTKFDLLPNELLIEVLVRIPKDARWPWDRILQTCKRWLLVGRQSATLWCEVHVHNRGHIRLLRDSLRYSVTAPVDIFFSSAMYHSTAFTLLSPHLYRVRRLQVHGVKSGNKALAALLRREMPILEELQLQLTSDQPARMDSRGDFVPWSPELKQFPSIKRLSLGYGVHLTAPLRTALDRLTCLELRNCHTPLFLQDPQRAVSAATPASSALYVLLEDKAGYTKLFLPLLDIPLHVDVHITCALRRLDYYRMRAWRGDSVEYIDEIAKVLPTHSQALPNIVLCTSVQAHRLSGSSYRLLGRTHAGRVIELTAEANGVDGSGMTGVRDSRIMGELVAVFSGSPVTELRFGGLDSSALDASDCVRALRAFPSLACLAIERTSSNVLVDGQSDARMPTLDALCAPVARCGSDDSPGGLGDGRYAEDGVVVPHLRCLIVELKVSGAAGEFADQVAKCLEKRTACGSRLAALDLVLKLGQQRDEPSSVKRLCTAALRDLVDNFQYEGFV
ncbi:hypothetical protein C8Q80DRAFT_1275794 [Daedaleopsis nitida]|nr:hypothetical protein C8Q80DRAFT_1275794 [Daedaleopsis nitida]